MQFINWIINIFYPNVCGMCNKICKEDICPKCMRKLNQIKQCKKHIYLKRNFTTHMYIFKYEDIVKNSIVRYKFNDNGYVYKAFVKFMRNNKKICGFFKKYDIIIPVPISTKRYKTRGYNQSELIIKEFAKKFDNIYIKTDILYKIKNVVPQSSLKREQRAYNIKNAYHQIQSKLES